MDTEKSRIWSWFCRDFETGSAESDMKFIDEGDECAVNVASFLLHLVFTVISLIVLSCCVFFSQTFPYIARWPGHICRWIVACILLLCALASIAEGILTEMVRKENGYLQPQFYLPGSMFFLAIIVSLIYNRIAERYQAPRLSWLLFLYWVVCIIINGWRIALLVREEVAIDAAVLWITASKIALFIVLLFLEFHLICSKIFSVCGLQTRTTDVKYTNMKYTEDFVSFLHYITFWWMNWLFRLGFKRPLEINDLGTLPDSHRAQHLYEIFKEDFQREINYKASSDSLPSVWKVFGRVYRGEIFYAGVNRLIYEFMCLIGPLALNGVVVYAIKYGQTNEVEAHPYVTVEEFFFNGFVLIAVIFLSNVIQYFSYQQNLYMSNLTGIHIRTSIQTMVYDKALRLSSYTISGGSMTVGQITNHMSVDAYNMFFFSQRLHYLWAVPFRVIAVVGLLYLQVGLASFLALGTLVLGIILQLLASQIQKAKQKIVMRHSDERLKKSNEMLLGIKLLKMYGWEEMFCKAIEAVRKLEMSSIFKYNASYGFNVLIVQATIVAVNLVVYVSYPYITGKTLEPNTTFAALALMNLLSEPMYFVPMLISLLVNSLVGVRRLQAFFLAPETERSHDIPWNTFFRQDKKNGFVHHQTDVIEVNADETTPLLPQISYGSIAPQTKQEIVTTLLGEKGSYDTFALKIENGDFTWGSSLLAPVLKNINLEIPHGELTMIVGPVGSGKSSLLSAILGEMTSIKGSIKFGTDTNATNTLRPSGIAFGAQKAWLMNATLQDNVLFGMPFNRGRYRKIIDACALKPDIDILPGGDMTEIGEKGINLSGGQKQRVSVARTMYSNKPIVLLDDPLSALDVNVGGHLFRNGIMGRLRKANRTVVLVTHQLQYLQKADKIVIMKEGQIHFQGTFDDVARADPEMYRKWQQDVIAASDTDGQSDGLSGYESTKEERDHLKKQVNLLKKRSVSPGGVSQGGVGEMNSIPAEDTTKGKLTETEDLARGSVPASTYWYYIFSMGLFWAVIAPLGRFSVEVGLVSRNFLLTAWADAGLDGNRTVNSITHQYVSPYVGISCACVFVAGVYVTALVIATWNAAGTVYLKMLRNITRSPNRFFDTTPIGRILNRFSSDTQIIDSKLVITLSSLQHFFFSFMSAILVNAIITPIFIAEAVPIILAYVILGFFFIRSSRELQRLDSVTRSPVFAHFSETLGGLTTIRSYREQHHFFNTLLQRIDTNNTAFQYLQASYGWLGLQMSICGGLMVLMVGLTAGLQATVFGTLDPASVGLALSYVLLVSVQLFNLIRFAADTEMQMNPVERVQFYANTPTENYDGMEPPADWPSRGEIALEDISVRYANTLPPVVHDVSLYVKPGEKVGICGRTGSGKSSLTLALLRLIETFKGKIVIDGEDIARMPLTTLRQRLSIIPQDPILFTGSIRSNLDPLGYKSDEDLWNALEIAQLKPIVSGFHLGLDTPVSEGGENFSVGQRQLFCLARAFLRNSRVLIMDEATASIDYTTEKLLQDVVASAFEDKTVLTIAHRVSTILESDTIWVLRDGEVIECDSPQRLLDDKTTEFYSMVQANK